LIIPSWFYLALDLGQAHDPSAIVLVERRMRNAKTPVYLVRGALRLPLGTPYPEVVVRVRKILESYEVAGKCSVVVDATGVGAPVVDMLRSALTGLRHGNAEIMAVTMTAGEQATEGRSSFGILRWNVPKRDLMSGVQLLLERGELRIAKELREAGQLIKELLDIRAKTKSTGRVRMGADGCGEHDDLAIALALACWRGQKARGIVGGGGRLPGI
jgi:hypothetical protein